MKRICVFCGSNTGTRADYRAAAHTLTAALARQGLGLVYGGGNIGLMGEIADSMLRAGGEVIGVIPRALMDKEVGHGGLSALHIVETMHQRKALMNELSDAFIALPGGFGTLDEFFEILTWAQLGLHDKPCGLLNVAGYYDHLLRMLDHAEAERFLRGAHRALVMAQTDVDALLRQLAAFTPLRAGKWTDAQGNFS